VVSKGQCITAVQVFSVNLGGTAVAVDPVGPVVEFVSNGIETGLVESAQVSTLG
jgi:hypothetical protein